MPDNLRSGVSKASRQEPDVNPAYHDLAEHSGVAVPAARARRPNAAYFTITALPHCSEKRGAWVASTSTCFRRKS